MLRLGHFAAQEVHLAFQSDVHQEWTAAAVSMRLFVVRLHAAQESHSSVTRRFTPEQNPQLFPPSLTTEPFHMNNHKFSVSSIAGLKSDLLVKRVFLQYFPRNLVETRETYFNQVWLYKLKA